MEKRGQFYLVAALVIIGVIASLATVYNNVRVSEKDVSVYDLSEEINYEVLQLLDSGSFFVVSENDTKEYITNLTDYYSELNPNTDIIIIYGNKNKDFVNVIAYTLETTGEICSTNACVQITEREFIEERLNLNSDKVIITLGDERYIFDINDEGQNFYLILKKEGEGDIFVSTNEPLPEEQPSCGNENEECCSGNTCNADSLFCYTESNNQDSKCLDKCFGNNQDNNCEAILGALQEGERYDCKSNGECKLKYEN